MVDNYPIQDQEITQAEIEHNFNSTLLELADVPKSHFYTDGKEITGKLVQQTKDLIISGIDKMD